MTVHHTHDFKPFAPGAFGGGLSRTLFFDGMVLTEADMMREQSYWRMKRKLTNRALGEGIVWGLTVDWDPQSRSFTVCPGYALSCCGEDLIVECPEVVSETQLIDVCSEDFRLLLKDRADRCGDARPDGPVEACLFLEYVECPEDPRRVYEDPCAETAKGCRFGAVRETVRLRLVPPPRPEPAGPVERFCCSIAAIRAELAAAGVAMPEPVFGNAPEAKVSVAHLRADGTVIGGQSEDLALTLGATAEARNAPAETPAGTRIGLEPPVGYAFTAVSLDGTAQTGLQALMGISYDLGTGFSNTASPVRTVVAEIAPVFGTAPGWRVTVTLTPQLAGGDTVAAAVVTAVEALPAGRDCSSLFADPLIFTGDTACSLKALALAALYGWFAGALAPADCATAEEARARAELGKGRAGLAWSITWMAWKALYGFDIANPQAAVVQNCLRRLFADWCDGFHYKGPRCDTDLHGVYLGCVEITPRGKIVCFHEWEHRRYVLTGPLLTHWGSQLGLAPIDVVAGRFAEWICCVSQARIPAPAAADIPADGASISLGGGAVAWGRSFATATRVQGAAIARQREVSPVRLAGEVLRMMAGGREASFATASEVEVVSAKGTGLSLLVPRQRAFQQLVSDSSAIRVELGGLVARTPPMAREAMVDFVREVAAVTPVSALKLETDNATFEPLIAALEKEGVTTVADLVRLGPEPAVERVRASADAGSPLADAVAADKAMAQIYAKAVATLSSAGEAIAKEASGRDTAEPFTRADLREAIGDVQQAAGAHLKKGTLSRQTLGVAATKAIAARA